MVGPCLFLGSSNNYTFHTRMALQLAIVFMISLIEILNIYTNTASLYHPMSMKAPIKYVSLDMYLYSTLSIMFNWVTRH